VTGAARADCGGSQTAASDHRAAIGRLQVAGPRPLSNNQHRCQFNKSDSVPEGRKWNTSSSPARCSVTLLLSSNLAAQRPADAQVELQERARRCPDDFNGYWVSIVTEQWRYRHARAGQRRLRAGSAKPRRAQNRKRLGSSQGSSEREECKSYGAAALLQVPGRLHIYWQTTRRSVWIRIPAPRLAVPFRWSPASDQAPTWQGYSVALWEEPNQGPA